METVDYDTEDATEESVEQEVLEVSKLEPAEISAYVNSLKDTAKYWYDTFFPMQSDNLSKEEKLWIDRLNRIGIGYFRPLVMVIISRRDLSEEQRVDAFRAMERFIFICFRLGYFNATFRSSEYYRAARNIYLKQMEISDLVDDITETTNSNIEYAIPNFVTKIEKHFNNMGGFYYWNSIKYFLYEYELNLAQKNNLDKVSWEMFTKTEKDKISIEHILPQTPTKYYWRNQFRQFDDEEIELLSCALGNLLPLSQSINSSLQNDSFDDKKTSKYSGRRGYQNGSHSEIEVSKEADWSADRIYQRSKALLGFMENRWQFSFTSEQIDELIYVTFAIDGREIPNPIDETTNDAATLPEIKSSPATDTNQELGNQQLLFWTRFIEYCEQEGRAEDMASRKPYPQNWYDIPVIDADFRLSFTVTRGKYLSLLIYAYNGATFSRLESKKEKIESVFGDKLDWYSSKPNSVAKRIIYKKECEIFNPAKQQELFSWMIDKYDELCNALVVAGELDEDTSHDNKFDALKKYLQEIKQDEVTLSFSDVEKIIGTELCKSAYYYSAYWHPSPTHTLPNTILDAGYKIALVDLMAKNIQLEKQR